MDIIAPIHFPDISMVIVGQDEAAPDAFEYLPKPFMVAFDKTSIIFLGCII
jgi:hypothetical protein